MMNVGRELLLIALGPGLYWDLSCGAVCDDRDESGGRWKCYHRL